MSAKLFLLSGTLLLATGLWFSGQLPSPTSLRPSVRTDPEQTMVTEPAYHVRVGDVDYTIEPVASYDISGVVVSQHHADTWWDDVHAAWKDHLNVTDLCMVWGANAADGAYQNTKYSSGQFTCYFSGRDSKAFQPQYSRAVSNNHLLTDNPAVARQLLNVRLGDQIRIRGQLVSYSHHTGFAFHRGTSTTRDDTGDGACETIFVRDLQVLRSAPGWPRWLFWVGVALMSLGLFRWFTGPRQPGG